LLYSEGVVYWGMTEQQAYEAGFESTISREEIPAHLLPSFDEGVADERAVAQAEMAEWHQDTSGYGWDT
tara:strand:+ start:12975 stop:13181 length:207 start_codon:yes stop_codon:yes gene_type:complete